MNKPHFLIPAILASAFAVSAHSQAIYQHPAMLQSASLASIDASLIVTRHPAEGFNGEAPHANHEHPAVIAAREAAAHSHIDANAYLVQPPASTSWTQGPAEEATDAKVAIAPVAVTR